MKIWARASTCLSVVAGSTMKAALPLPSWMALGHTKMPAPFTPSSLTSPHRPFVTVKPTSARQLPSFEFGKPPKLHPQPKSQLQNSYPTPLICQRVLGFVFVAVAMGPSGASVVREM